MPEYIIDDDFKDNDQLFPKDFARGAVPRDFAVTPMDALAAPPSEIKKIPRSEWSERIKEMEETKSRLSDLLLRGDKGRPIPSTDQNGHGYCWAYSVVGAMIAKRAFNNLPYLKLNPHGVAAIIKNGRDQGGWCGLSAKYVQEHGCPTEEFWPRHSRSLSNNTPEMRENAARHKMEEGWFDFQRNVHSQHMDFDQVISCLLNRIPCAGDFNWWGHSVLLCDAVEVERGSFGIRIRNSWTDGWGDKGFSVLRGNKAIPNGAVGIRVVSASV